MRFGSVLLVLVMAATGSGCSSKEEKLVEQRLELRRALDTAYSAYGGGDIASRARAEAQKDPKQENSAAAQVLGEADRTFFEQYCISAGSGERLFNFSAKLDAWLKNEKNLDMCKKAAKASIKVAELERKAAGG